MAIINAPINAGIKPETVNPFTIKATSQKRSALITKVKRPRVRRVSGSVSNNNIGRIIRFSIPSTKATRRAVPNPETAIPDTR